MIPHSSPLITTLVFGLTLALIFGTVAYRLKISPLVGYLLAGVAIGPSTPGFIGDIKLAQELAEVGIILLMFGVGLHFSLKDLLSVRALAIPGAIVQILAATVMGLLLSLALGWTIGAGIVFGLALSVASTVVLMRTLQERRLLSSERGKLAVGWLIVEDIVMVLALVLLPALAPLMGGMGADGETVLGPGAQMSQILGQLGITVAKIGAFFIVMLVVGRRVIPWILHWVVHTGSRELFRLCVLAIALGVAYASSSVFGVSLALGAFFAGMILSESTLSQQAAAEALPFRDAFAVLFFISAGMLFDPSIVISHPWALLATLLIILIGKSLAALMIVLLFRHPMQTALLISASLAQIGEFSFILGDLGVSLNLLPSLGRDLIIAGAILSIIINPAFFFVLDRMKAAAEPSREPAEPAATPEPEEVPVTRLTGHTILIGHGRVGSRVASEIIKRGQPLLVMEESDNIVAEVRKKGVEALNGTSTSVLVAANPAAAAALVVTIPNGFEAGALVEAARNTNPNLLIIARSHSDAETEHLKSYGANTVILGEEEIATSMVAHLPPG